jgi:hypothetical protein
MTSTFPSPHAFSRAFVPAGAGVCALAAIVAMCAVQVVVSTARSPAQGPPGHH